MISLPTRCSEIPPMLIGVTCRAAQPIGSVLVGAVSTANGLAGNLAVQTAPTKITFSIRSAACFLCDSASPQTPAYSIYSEERTT